MRRRRPFVPLDVGFWDDPKVIAAGDGAAVLYLRMLCWCKANGSDGRVPWGALSRMGDRRTVRRRLDACINAAMVAAEWQQDGRISAAIVLSWRRHNAAETPGQSVRLPSSEAVRGPSITAPTGATAVPLARGVETEIEVITSPKSNLSLQPGAGEVGLGGELATQLLRLLGYATAQPTAGMTRYVERALALGWSPEQLTDLASSIAGRSDVDDARHYLLGCLRGKANAGPTLAIDAASWAAQWAQVERLAAGGVHSWLDRPELPERTRLAAHQVRQAIRTSDTTTARLAFRSAYGATSTNGAAA